MIVLLEGPVRNEAATVPTMPETRNARSVRHGRFILGNAVSGRPTTNGEQFNPVVIFSPVVTIR
jgi:hypothetical protein